MFTSCATQDHNMSGWFVTFSDLGRILRLLLFRVDITTEQKCWDGYYLARREQLYAEQDHVYH
jgi:hypothetical protein